MAPRAHSDRRAYHRRDFVSITAAAVTSRVLARPSLARAQEKVENATAAVDANREEAQELLEKVLYKTDPSFDDATGDDIAEQHYQLVIQLASILYPLPDKIRATLLDPDQLHLASIVAQEAEVVPRPDEIERPSLNETPAFVEQNACDPYRAIFFIILDAVGFNDDDRAAIVELVRGTPIQSKLEQIVDGYPDRNWEETAEQITDLLKVIAGAEFMVKFSKQFGNQAVRRISRKMSLYFVPYAGWVYVVIVVCASIKKNWNLLIC